MGLTRGSSEGRNRFAACLSGALSPRVLGAARATAGVAMITRPTDLTSLMGVDPGAAEQTAWVVQMLGAREVAVGAGGVLGLGRDRRGARLWLTAGLVCDVVDALAVGAAVRGKRVPALQGGGLVALAATAVGIQGAALVRRR